MIAHLYKKWVYEDERSSRDRITIKNTWLSFREEEYMVLKVKNEKNRKWYFLVLYIVIVIAIVFVFRKYVDNKVRQQSTGVLEDLAHHNVMLIETKVNDTFQKLNNLATEIVAQKNYDYIHNRKEMKHFAEVLGFREIGVAQLDGTAYMSTDTKYNVSKRDYFKRSIKGEQYISEILNDMRDHAKVNIYSVPIKSKTGDVKGVLFGISDAEDFMKIFQIPIFNGYGYTYLIDEKGNVVSGSYNEEIEMTNLLENLGYDSENKEAKQSLSSMLQERKGGSLYFNAHGYCYANFTPLNVNNWNLVTVVPEDILQQQAKTITSVMQMISLGIILGATGILAFFIRLQKKSEEALKKIAYIDALTGLYNKPYFEEKFIHNIKAKSRNQAALVVFNIRKFKIINEIYGEHVGSNLLKSIATILEKTLRFEKEMVMHGYADEFLALYFYNTKEELEERITTFLSKIHTVSYKNNRIKINMAVGIYEIDSLECSFERAYSYVNMAKKQHKNSLVSSFEYYSDKLKANELEQKKLNDEIKEGIQKKEFKAWFQPKYDIETGDIVGAEALARWYKNDNILSPYYFVEFSERVGFIQEIDRLIIEDVCEKMSRWYKQGLPYIPVSVNLSRAYLNNEDAICYLKEILEKYHIPKEYIQLEITESCIVDSEQELAKVIDFMHELGFQVLLDDFGVGYSSLTSINNLKFDILKIDKSFVDSIGNVKGEEIVKYTISLGKKLGMDIIAEGVETKEQYEFLKQEGCNMIQGYYFCKPLSSDDFEKLLYTLEK